jgi:hypothetical protein
MARVMVAALLAAIVGIVLVGCGESPPAQADCPTPDGHVVELCNEAALLMKLGCPTTNPDACIVGRFGWMANVCHDPCMRPWIANAPERF